MALLAAMLVLASAAPPAAPVISPETGLPEQALVVLAAASLREPLQACARAFERAHPGSQVALTTAATGVLLREVDDGAPADIVIGASASSIDRLVIEGSVQAPSIIARNGLVVAAPADSTLRLRSLAELRQPAVKRIALGRRDTVPAGQYAWESLQKLRLTEALNDRLIQGESAAQVLQYVESGDVSVGFVYESDLHIAGSKVRQVLAVPDELHAPITYPAAILKRSTSAALAGHFIEYLTSPEGQALLTQAGLRPR